jgi:origin recognition complex subunit 1
MVFVYHRNVDDSVLLLDELDQLVMAKQTVLYNLFNWPTLPNSRLIVVAIANTMNLADMLPNKIQSRVGKTTQRQSDKRINTRQL